MKPYYQDDAVTIYHGDCRKILPVLSFDLMIVDPPYLEGDFSWLLEFCERVVVTPGKLKSFDWIARKKPDWEYAWRGSSPSLGGSACLHIGFEPVLAYGMPHTPFGNDVLDYPIITYRDHDGKPSKDHPWPKPEGLFRKLILHFAKEFEVTVDACMGIGTTLRAAKDLGRKAIGIEIEEKYCEIAAKRMAQEVFDFTPSEIQNGEILDTAPLFH